MYNARSSLHAWECTQSRILWKNGEISRERKKGNGRHLCLFAVSYGQLFNSMLVSSKYLLVICPIWCLSITWILWTTDQFDACLFPLSFGQLFNLMLAFFLYLMDNCSIWCLPLCCILSCHFTIMLWVTVYVNACFFPVPYRKLFNLVLAFLQNLLENFSIQYLPLCRIFWTTVSDKSFIFMSITNSPFIYLLFRSSFLYYLLLFSPNDAFQITAGFLLDSLRI